MSIELELTCDEKTLGERISIIVAPTHTYGHMIADAALCICSTQPGTGIHAAPADTGSVYRTVRVHLAFWPAVGRGAQHSGQAGALALLPVLARWEGVRTTGVWLAGILFSNIRCNCYRCGEHAKF